MMTDVTNSKKDWDDFWYNSIEDYPAWTNNRNPPINMDKVTTKERKSFDELYKEYSSMSIPEQLTNLKELGRDLVNKLDGIIDQLDTVLKDDSVGENDIDEVEIQVDPITHKVVYNRDKNEYNVIKRQGR